MTTDHDYRNSFSCGLMKDEKCVCSNECAKLIWFRAGFEAAIKEMLQEEKDKDDKQ